MEVVVFHQKEKSRFMATVRGKEAFMKYARPEDQVLEVVSTFIPAELRGQGIACQIATFACQYAQTKQLKLRVTCPYLSQFLENNPAVYSIVKPA